MTKSNTVPGQTNGDHDRIDRDPERARVLGTKLDEIVQRLSRPITVPQAPISEMDPEAISGLRALGYIP